jgi:pyridoxamine 5'-phosphate oxidase-like protein
MTIRNVLERKNHVLYRLQHSRDVWVATAHFGRAHLVPLSLSWDGVRVIAATKRNSLTARNLEQSHQARVSVGDTRDVVLLDVVVEVVPVGEPGSAVSEQFIIRNGWDPREANGDWVNLIMTPIRIQAWQSEEELVGRTIMTHGTWLT